MLWPAPRARPRADQEWLELKVWRFVACRETRYGGSVWSWELKFGVSRGGARGQTMNLLVHLVCSYYGTRPRPRMHGPDSPSAHLCRRRGHPASEGHRVRIAVRASCRRGQGHCIAVRARRWVRGAPGDGGGRGPTVARHVCRGFLMG